MEQSHGEPHYDRNFANGSAVADTVASLGRVAHAGNGNCTRSGIGISGCDTITEPGLRIPARVRLTGGKKLYSLCCASAKSSRPTTRKAQFPTTRGST